MTNPVLNLTKYRARLDDNSEILATYVTATSTPWTQTVDTNFRVRFEITETAGGMRANATLKLQYSRNNGTWSPVSAGATHIISVSSENYANFDDCTQQLGLTPLSFIAANSGMIQGAEQGSSTEPDFGGNDQTETEWCLQVVSANTIQKDSFQLRLLINDLVLSTYVVTANFTAIHAQQALAASLLTDTDQLFHGEVAEPDNSQNIQGTRLNDGDTFNHGKLNLLLFNSLFSDSDTFRQGLITLFLEGSLFPDADSLNHGLITVDISGSILSDSDTFFNGLVSPQNLFGSLLSDADTFEDGTLRLFLEGSLFQDADDLNHGEVALGAVNVRGSTLEDTDTFNQAKLDLILFGSLFQDSDSLNHGSITTEGGTQSIESSLFSDGDTFNTGLIAPQNLFGSLLTDTDTINDGEVDQGVDVKGSLFEDDDSLNHGEIAVGNVNLNGSLFQDGDTLSHGEVGVEGNAIEGSFLQDSDSINQGEVNPGSINIAASKLTNTSTFNHGQVDLILSGSFLENTNIIRSGDVSIFAIQGSLFQDLDLFYDLNPPAAPRGFKIAVIKSIIGAEHKNPHGRFAVDPDGVTLVETSAGATNVDTIIGLESVGIDSGI